MRTAAQQEASPTMAETPAMKFCVPGPVLAFEKPAPTRDTTRSPMNATHHQPMTSAPLCSYSFSSPALASHTAFTALYGRTKFMIGTKYHHTIDAGEKRPSSVVSGPGATAAKTRA